MVYSCLTNYETWNFRNYYGENFTDRTEEIAQDLIDGKAVDVIDLRGKIIEKLVEELTNCFDEQLKRITLNGYFADIARNCINRINFKEIAEALSNDIDIYSTRFNVPGCLPDCDPAIFLNFEDAKACVIDEIESLILVEEDDSRITDMQDAIETINSESGEFGIYVGDYFYSVEKF